VRAFPLLSMVRFRRQVRIVQRHFAAAPPGPTPSCTVALGVHQGQPRMLDLAQVEDVLEISGDQRWASSLLCALAAQLSTGLSGRPDVEVLITAGVHPQFAGPSRADVLAELERRSTDLGTEPATGPDPLTIVICGALDGDDAERIALLTQTLSTLRFVTTGPYPGTRWRLPITAAGQIEAPALDLSADVTAIEQGIARVLRRARPTSPPQQDHRPTSLPVVPEPPANAETPAIPEIPARSEALSHSEIRSLSELVNTPQPTEKNDPAAVPEPTAIHEAPQIHEPSALLSFADAFAQVPESMHRPLLGLLGLTDLERSPFMIDLSGPAHAFMIAGPAGSGRSNTLAALAVSLLATGTKLIVILPRESPLERLAVHPYVQLHLGSRPDAGRIADQLGVADGPVAILLDDVDRLDPEHPLDPVLREVVATGRERGIGLIYAGSAPSIKRAGDSWTGQAGGPRPGVLLAPQDGRDGDLLAIDVPDDLRGTAAIPGRGYTVATPHDGVRAVLIPHTELG
jgi:hypothetical protein